jgi:hypothetical protein
VCGRRPTADGDEDRVALDDGVVGEDDPYDAVLAAHALGAHIDPDVDPELAQRLTQLRAGKRLLAREQPRPALDDRHRTAERRVRLRHLDAHHASPEDDQPVRDPRCGRHLAIGPGLDVGQPGNRRDRRATADRDHDSLPRLVELVADAHATLAVQPAVAADQIDAAVVEPRHLLGVVEVVDDLVTAPEHRLDVDVRGHGLGRGAPRQAPAPGAAAPWRACTRRRSTRLRRDETRRSRSRVPSRPRARRAPRRPARLR